MVEKITEAIHPLMITGKGSSDGVTIITTNADDEESKEKLMQMIWEPDPSDHH